MAKKHQTQHKPSRDNRLAKEIQELKRENNQLRRKVGKLQKYLQKALERTVLSEDKELNEPVKLDAPVVGCQECSGQLVALNLPTGSLMVCKACGWKKKGV